MIYWIGIILTGLATVASTAFGVEVQGHRGARARLPENTLPAFDYALSVGVDTLEMDLAVTKDGVLVISHDPHVNPEICLDPLGRKIDSAPLIHDLTLKELKKYDCGTLRNPRFAEQKPVPGTTIPTLSEVFELVKKSDHPAAKNVGFNIETKIFPDHPEYTVSPEEFSRLAVEAFRKSGITLKRIVLQSFDPRTLVLAKKLQPELQTSLLVEQTGVDLAAAGKKYGVQILSPNWQLLDAAQVERLHQAGFRVIPWTPNTPEAWNQLLKMKVDGIITDDPAQLMKHLNR